MSDPIVLVPGLQSDATSWMPLVGELCHTHPLSIPMGHQFAPDIAAMADSVLAQSPARFHLIGWSMGGYVAFEVLRRAPERLASLALISTTAAPESAASRVRRAEALNLARSQGIRGYQQSNLAMCLFDPHSVDPARTDPLLRASEVLGLRALEIQTAAIVDRPDSRPDLAASAVPLLILAGTDDRVIPVTHAREMHTLRPDAAYHEISECGHCPPIEKPQLVAEILTGWLNGLDPRPASAAHPVSDALRGSTP